MRQTLRFGFGAVQSIAGLLNRLQAGRIFLVTGGASFESSGAAAALTPLLKSRSVLRFSGFAENPRIEDVAAGIRAFRSATFDAVIAVGGGSVMDMAKLVNALAGQADPEGRPDLTVPVRGPGLPLIAVPTTSGSGSEATHFGVTKVYSATTMPCNTLKINDLYGYTEPRIPSKRPGRRAPAEKASPGKTNDWFQSEQ